MVELFGLMKRLSVIVHPLLTRDRTFVVHFAEIPKSSPEADIGIRQTLKLRVVGFPASLLGQHFNNVLEIVVLDHLVLVDIEQVKFVENLSALKISEFYRHKARFANRYD